MKSFAEYGPLAIFFAVFFMAGKDIYLATIALMISYSIGMLLLWRLEGKLSRMHQIMWLAIMIFGGLTIFLKNELFIKWKPSIANWAIGSAFLGSHFIGKQPLIQSMMGSSIKLDDKDWKTLSWMWISFFIICGLLNLYVAYNFPTDFWVKFKVFGLIGLTIVFSILQGFWLVKKGEFIEDAVVADQDQDLDKLRLNQINKKLSQSFPDAQISLEDESHLHIGHAGAKDGRGHFKLHIISDQFQGLTRVQRHQLVYKTLGEMMESDIHALSVTAVTSSETFGP